MRHDPKPHLNRTMKLQTLFKRRSADVILITAIVALCATQVAMDGLTGNALFNTFVAVVCAGVIKLYAARFGSMGFSVWRSNNARLAFMIVLFCGACASFLMYAALASHIGPIAALAGFLLCSFIIVSWLLLTEMAKTAWNSALNRKNG